MPAINGRIERPLLQPVHNFADTQQTLLTFLSFFGLGLGCCSFPRGIWLGLLCGHFTTLLWRLWLLGCLSDWFRGHICKVEISLLSWLAVVAFGLGESLCGHLGHLSCAFQLGRAALERTVLVGSQKVCFSGRLRLAALTQSDIETLVICMCTTKTFCQF